MDLRNATNSTHLLMASSVFQRLVNAHLALSRIFAQGIFAQDVCCNNLYLVVRIRFDVSENFALIL